MISNKHIFRFSYISSILLNDRCSSCKKLIHQIRINTDPVYLSRQPDETMTHREWNTSKPVIDLNPPNKFIDDAVQINSRYLLDHPMMKDMISDWVANKFVLAIKSAIDTGNMQMLKHILDSFEFEKILWITHSRPTAESVCGSLQDYGFKSPNMCEFYEHGDSNKPNVYDLGDLCEIDHMPSSDAKNRLFKIDRVVVQINDLNFVTTYDEHDDLSFNEYDLVIVDQVEECLTHYSIAPLIARWKDGRNAFNVMVSILKNAYKVVLLDIDMGVRSMLLIDDLTSASDSACMIYNSFVPIQKTFKIMNDNNCFNKMLLSDIKAGKNVCVISMSEDEINLIDKRIRWEGCKYHVYTSMTNNRSDDLKNINALWSQYQVVLYSQMPNNSVSFEAEHFDRIYAILADGFDAPSPRAFLQMINCIGKVRDPVIPCLHETIGNTKRNKPILDEAMFTTDDMVKINTLRKTKYKEERSGGVLKCERIPLTITLFDKICMHNEAEKSNRHCVTYTTVLAKVIAETGHKISFKLNTRILKERRREMRREGEI